MQNLWKKYTPETSPRLYYPRQLMLKKNSYVNKIF